MESLDELSKTTSGKPGFFKHVFNFDEDSKAEMLNLIQYIVLALIPVIILNKLMQKYVPEADDEKGSLEITAEVLAQVLFMFFGILLINRIVTYLPTYSGEKYPDFSVFPSYSFIPYHFTGLKYEGHKKVYCFQEWGSTKQNYEIMNLISNNIDYMFIYVKPCLY
jgi:hypothetical protein